MTAQPHLADPPAHRRPTAPSTDVAAAHAELAAALARRPAGVDLAGCRELIDAVDSLLGLLLARRVELVELAQTAKRGRELPVRDPDREAEIARRVASRAPRLGLGGAAAVMRAVVDACLEATAPVSA